MMSENTFLFVTSLLFFIVYDCVEASYGYYSRSRYYYNYYYSSDDDGNGWIVGVVIGGVIGGICLILVLYVCLRWCILKYKKPTFQVKPHTTRAYRNRIQIANASAAQQQQQQQQRQRHNPQTRSINVRPTQDPSQIQNNTGYQYNLTQYPQQSYPPTGVPGYPQQLYTPPSEMPPPPAYTVNDEHRDSGNGQNRILSPPPSYSEAIIARPGNL